MSRPARKAATAANLAPIRWRLVPLRTPDTVDDLDASSYSQKVSAMRTFRRVSQYQPVKQANAEMRERHRMGVSEWLLSDLMDGREIDWNGFPAEPSSIDESVFYLLQVAEQISPTCNHVRLEGDSAIRALADAVAVVVLDLRNTLAGMKGKGSDS